MRGKYIVFERWDGLTYPVLFPDHFVTHDMVKVASDKPISAGFFQLNSNGGFSVYGQSVSLKLKSNPDDSHLIAKQFNPE